LVTGISITPSTNSAGVVSGLSTSAAGVVSWSQGTNVPASVTNSVPPGTLNNATTNLTIDFTASANGVVTYTQTSAVSVAGFTFANTNHEAALLVEWYGNGSSVTWTPVTNILTWASNNVAPSIVSGQYNRIHFSAFRGRVFGGWAGSAP
jgi:hypothetical protein